MASIFCHAVNISLFMPSTTRDRTRTPRASTPGSILRTSVCVTLLSIWRLVKNFTAQIRKSFPAGPLTDNQPCSQASTTQLSTLSPAAISPLRARARFAGSVLIRFDSLHAVVGSVSVLILTHNNTPLGPTSTGTGTRSPGACPPLISSEHVGAARADAPGVIVLIQERVLRKVCVWGPLRAW